MRISLSLNKLAKWDFFPPQSTVLLPATEMLSWLSVEHLPDLPSHDNLIASVMSQPSPASLTCPRTFTPSSHSLSCFCSTHHCCGYWNNICAPSRWRNLEDLFLFYFSVLLVESFTDGRHATQSCHTYK